VRRQPLRDALTRTFQADGATGPVDAMEALGSLRILAADDYPANLRIVVRLLEKRGHTVETVTTGAAAAAAVLASHYDLVLMDCRMPEMDGYEATALIRASEGGRRRTPIIALTANDSDDDRRRCVDVGMDGFVAKPLRPAELFTAIEQALGCVSPG
jgi:CheY-like chemotaxis protein